MRGQPTLENMQKRIRRVEARINLNHRYVQRNSRSYANVAFAKAVLHVLERSLKLMRLQYGRLECEVRKQQEQATKKAQAERRLRIARMASADPNKTIRTST